MNRLPVIGGDFVELVAMLRDAEAELKKHQTRQAEAKVARIGVQVDAKIEAYRRDVAKLDAYLASMKTDEHFGVYQKKTDETPGVYDPMVQG